MNYKKFRRKLQLISILLCLLLTFNPLIVSLAYAQEIGQDEYTNQEEQVESNDNEENSEDSNQDDGEVDHDQSEEVENDDEIDDQESDGEEDGENDNGENDDDEKNYQEENQEENREADIEVGVDEGEDEGDKGEELEEAEDGDNDGNETEDNESELEEEVEEENNQATSSAELSIQANVNQLDNQLDNQQSTFSAELDEKSEPEDEKEVLDEPSEKDKDKTINQNQSEVENEIDVQANTGENQSQTDDGDVIVETGDAIAYANLLNLLNLNIAGSDFGLYFQNLLDNSDEEIDLNAVWNELVKNYVSKGLSIENEEELTNFLFANQNYADLENLVIVNANTGNNSGQTDNGSVDIDTGNALAMANVLNFVNININGSYFLIPVINIFGNFEGDLILPSREKFALYFSDQSENPNFLFMNENLAEVSNTVNSSANTGNNQTTSSDGDSLIQTGDAESYVNNQNFVNQNILFSNWFRLIINNLGGWEGKVYGWSSPDSVEDHLGFGPQFFEILNSGVNANEENEPNQKENNQIFANQNQAVVNNHLEVNSNTGGNQTNNGGGDTSIKTGHSKSIANLLNFINLNIWGSQWFFGLVNILGNWTGNLIFAYPDVVVNLSGQKEINVGDHMYLNLNYYNQGHDAANDVQLNLTLPPGVEYVEDNSGLPVDLDGQRCLWQIGSLQPSQAGSFSVLVYVSEDLQFDQPVSFLQKIIKPVFAADEIIEAEIQTKAVITTPDIESNYQNNTSLKTTQVRYEIFYDYDYQGDLDNQLDEDWGYGGFDNRQPVLELTAKNSVNEYMYVGDTVLFEIELKNTSDVTSYDTYVVHSIFNGIENNLGTAEFYYGDLKPNKRVVLTFGMPLENGFVEGGNFQTQTTAYGFAPNGNMISSNNADTAFIVKLNEVLFSAQAMDDRREKILGVEDEVNCPEARTDILPFIVLFGLSAFGLIDKTRKLIKFEGIKK